jgi:hypothetical protein
MSKFPADKVDKNKVVSIEPCSNFIFRNLFENQEADS